MDQSTLHVMQVVLSAIILVLVTPSDSQQHAFYIKPYNTSCYPEGANASQCYNLHTFISGKHWLSAPNITLLFFPGEHFLGLDLNARNTEEFWMIPYIQSNDNTARISITCTNFGQTINLQNISFVKIDSISFHSCGVETGYHMFVALQLMSVDQCEITNSKWYDSRSSAIFIQYSNTVISDCHFVRGNCSYCSCGGIHAENSNVTFTGSNIVTENTAWEGHGGGLYFNGCNVTFTGSNNITENSALMGNAYGGGLSMVKSNVVIDGDLAVAKNVAETVGGGMCLIDCILTAANTSSLLFEKNIAGSGGGLYLKKVKASIAGTTVFIGNFAIFYNQDLIYTAVTVQRSGAGGGSLFHISRCKFTGYTVYYNNSCLSGGGGLSIVKGRIEIANGNFTKNSAIFGGAIIGLFTGFVAQGKVTLTNNIARVGGGIAIQTSRFTFTEYAYLSANFAKAGGGIALYRAECIFKSTAILTGNKAKESGGSLGVFEGSKLTFLSGVKITDSTASWAGGGVFLSDGSSLIMHSEVFIDHNYAYSYGGAIALDHSVLRMKKGSEITSNSAQYGGAIHAITSELFFLGNHFFEHNNAHFGGGFSLFEGSLIHFSTTLHETHLQLTSNYAHKYGGALWIEDTPFYTCSSESPHNRKCFYRLAGGIQHALQYRKHFCVFQNNTAMLAGSNVYGGSINNCDYGYKETLSKVEMGIIFRLINESTKSSPISSDPRQVCFCTQYNEPDCSISNHTIEAFSGQQFPLILVGVGQMNGTIPAVIRSQTDPASSTTIKTAGGKCSTLFYNIMTDSSVIKLILYPESPCHNISTYMRSVLVKIKPCPPGFMLHNETKSCSCDDTMKKLDIECDINSQSFSHKHGVWVGNNQIHNHNINETLIFLYHTHCPFDYCTQEQSNFTFNSTDNQCRYNKSGLICGACKEGYSLTLGGSKCAQCSHVYLLLFLPLAVAGVVLVFFLLTFKLTVAMGTINGLIFFANTIRTNSSVFLPPESTAVLRVFIAWLNLDLGIDTCLCDGLDMYAKVWLQFVFPFYVFLLIGIIIVVSQNSSSFTKYLGSDPVAVLATLILLAYTKLFRAVLTVMSFTYIQASDGSSITVWLYDGNVRYLSGKHIPLFMFALLIFLFLIVPFTMILLLFPYLQPYSKNRVLFWIDDYRLKFFLYSYYAPMKDKYHSWIGLLLVLRLVIMIVFVSNSLGDPSINIATIASVVVLLLCWRVLFGTFYTNWYLDALELFFIMNLGLFSILAMYVLNSNGNHRALTDTLVGVVFLVFIVITLYHIWRQLIDSRFYRNTLKSKWQKHFTLRKNKDISSVTQEENEHCRIEPPKVSTTFIELREPLLEC